MNGILFSDNIDLLYSHLQYNLFDYISRIIHLYLLSTNYMYLDFAPYLHGSNKCLLRPEALLVS